MYLNLQNIKFHDLDSILPQMYKYLKSACLHPVFLRSNSLLSSHLNLFVASSLFAFKFSEGNFEIMSFVNKIRDIWTKHLKWYVIHWMKRLNNIEKLRSYLTENTLRTEFTLNRSAK
jgi:hypothetical protein